MQSVIKTRESWRYHCSIIPAMSGSNNLKKGEDFQKGIWPAYILQYRKHAVAIVVVLTGMMRDYSFMNLLKDHKKCYECTNKFVYS